MPDSISRADVSFCAFIREGRGLARFFNGRSPGVRARRCSSMIVSISRGRGLDQCEFRVPGQVPFPKIPSACAAASSTSRQCPGVAGWNDSVLAESTSRRLALEIGKGGRAAKDRTGPACPLNALRSEPQEAMLTGIWITSSCPHWEPAGNSAESTRCRRCSCDTGFQSND